MIFGHDLNFWITVAGAALLRLLLSKRDTLLKSVSTAFAAIFAALVFTRPTMDLLGLMSDLHGYAIAALWALTGEQLMRWVIRSAGDPVTMFKSILSVWRGK